MEYDRIVKRFDELQQEYGVCVSATRRAWMSPKFEIRDRPFNQIVDKYPDRKLDHLLSDIKLGNNIMYAQARNNKYLLSEDMTQFPIMNYDLKEGPYCPPDDAVFGPEDKHVVIQGDTDLIFFQTEINGLEKGLIVENLL